MAQGGEQSRSGKSGQGRHLSWVTTTSAVCEAGSQLPSEGASGLDGGFAMSAS